MSLLLVELVPQGIVFGADRNIHSEEKGTPEFIDGADGKSYYEVLHRYYSQAPRPKVLRWPKRKALIGYVGEAQINRTPTDEWLYDFIGDHPQIDSFETIAESLRQAVERQRRIDEGTSDPQPIIIHLAGFEERDGIQLPAVWVIRNDHDPPKLKDIRKEYVKEDCLWLESHDWYVPPQNLRKHLSDLAARFKPFWFHQGIDLPTFNLLEAFLKAGLRELYRSGLLDLRGPQNLEDWERQVRMSVLMYGAYYQAYQKPYEQYVGGGVDTVSIPWPE
jgi:hypothetical protein